MDHEWTFLGASHDDHVYVINVCTACGEARSKSVSPSGGEEHRVDLSGDCPGRSHRPTMYETRQPNT